MSFEHGGMSDQVGADSQSDRSKRVFVEIIWHINPFRGDKFEQAWRPAAEAALDYGASYWALLRAHEGKLDFFQHAIFPSKADFERYWYSERLAQARSTSPATTRCRSCPPTTRSWAPVPPRKRRPPAEPGLSAFPSL